MRPPATRAWAVVGGSHWRSLSSTSTGGLLDMHPSYREASLTQRLSKLAHYQELPWLPISREGEGRRPRTSSSLPADGREASRMGGRCGVEVRHRVPGEAGAGPGDREAALRSPDRAASEGGGCRARGLKVVPHDEVQDPERGVRPDYAIGVDGAVTGYVEVKKSGTSIDPLHLRWSSQPQPPAMGTAQGPSEPALYERS